MRMNKTLSLGCVVAMLAGMVGVASAVNPLTNSTFETGDLTGWQVFGASANATVTVVSGQNGPSAPGVFSAFLDNHAQAAGLTLKQSTPVGSAGPGTVLYSFDLKLGQAANGGVFFVELFAEQEGVGIIGGSGLLGNYTPANWTTFSGSFLAPTGTDFVTIQLTAVTGAVDGTVSSMYVDNVILDAAVPTEMTTWSTMKALSR
jgi:hypothetical protein